MDIALSIIVNTFANIQMFVHDSKSSIYLNGRRYYKKKTIRKYCSTAEPGLFIIQCSKKNPDCTTSTFERDGS